MANAAEFPKFREALQIRLARWLGTAWPDPRVGEFLGPPDTTSLEARRRVENTRARYTQWAASVSAKTFVNVRLDESDGDWSWLSARALAILSYLERAPFAMAVEAWALSRATMERPRHGDVLAWVLRLNLKDGPEATETLCSLLQRLGHHDHPICQQAVEYLEAAISHVQRADTPLVIPDSRYEDSASALQVSAMSNSELLASTQKYLLPYAWRTYEPETAAELVNTLILRGLDKDLDAFDLVLDHLRDLLVILTPESRKCIHQAISLKSVGQSGGPEQDTQRNFRLQSCILLLELYDAEAHEQSKLILNGGIGSEINDWLPVLRPIALADVVQPNFEKASDEDICRWLDYIARLLPREQVNKIEFLPQLIVDDDLGIRKAALRLAIHGHHTSALKEFAESSYSVPSVEESQTDREHEYLRHRVLIEHHNFVLPRAVADALRPESLALIAEHNPGDASALDQFHGYLRQQFSAIKHEKSWSSPRYWQSYKEAIDALAKKELDSILRWLRPWLAQPGDHLERALMDHFPVIDLMQTLGSRAPEASIELYRLLVEGTRGGTFSSEGLKNFPFSLPASKDTEELCTQQLTEATNDKTLSEIVYFSHKYDRIDWLFGLIEKLESCDTPVDVAKSYTLLGFCDKSGRADDLLQCFLDRPPTDSWLGSVLKHSVADYRTNQFARHAFAEIWSSKKASLARHAVKRVLDACDMRILLWIDVIQPNSEEWAFDRRLLWGWATPQLNAAMRKKWDTRKKKFLHTPLAYSIMSPWK